MNFSFLRRLPAPLLRNKIVQAAILSCSELFDARWYLDRYQDVRAANMNPYFHYLKYGAMELRNPGPHFETSWYVNKYPECLDLDMNPLLHRLLENDGLSLDDVSSPQWREEAELIRRLHGSKLFDPTWYLSQYPDVSRRNMEPFSHFLDYGAAEHRDPGPNFNTG